jgi:hypothetical protein
MRFLFPSLSVLLSAILAAGSSLEAQSVNPAGSEVQELHIRVLNGEPAPLEPGKQSRQALTVAISDGQGKPVPSATVLFRLPAEGASGVFSDGSRVAVLYSDLEGQATIGSIQWGITPGTAVIRVTAAKGTAHAGLLIEQVLTLAKRAEENTGSAPPPVGQPAEVKSADLQRHPNLRPATAMTDTVAPSQAPAAPPSVIISNNRQREITGASGKSRKWLWIGLGSAAAAGVALAFMGKGGSATGGTQPGQSGTTIGTPSVSIGHP